ncbi:MAG: hypothetical protein R3B09_36035 [Nannocystaceae bacterium]
MNERRAERSTIPVEAADLYLKAIAERTGLHTVALASHHGLCLSGLGERRDHLAAVAPKVAEEPASLPGSVLQPITGGESVQIWRVEVRGRPFYLAALGAPTHMFEEVQDALDRIFGRPSTPPN